MKCKILLLEDRLYTAENIKIFLQEYFKIYYSKELEIIVCNDIYEANEVLNKNNDISCIISDLCLSPDGLDEKYFEETLGTMLTGWVWIKYYILKNKEYSKIPIIIYSGFVSALKEDSDCSEYIDNYQIYLVEKGTGEKILCEQINKIITRKA